MSRCSKSDKKVPRLIYLLLIALLAVNGTSILVLFRCLILPTQESFEMDHLLDMVYRPLQFLVVGLLVGYIFEKRPSVVKEKSHSKNINSPPKLGEYLLYFFLQKTDRVYILGDLEEDYKEVLAKFGPTPARIWYYKQVFSSIGPLIWKRLLKWGAIAWIGELFRRHS
jgi:hypothetical protein